MRTLIAPSDSVFKMSPAKTVEPALADVAPRRPSWDSRITPRALTCAAWAGAQASANVSIAARKNFVRQVMIIPFFAVASLPRVFETR